MGTLPRPVETQRPAQHPLVASAWPTGVLRDGERSIVYSMRLSTRARYLRVTVNPSSGAVVTLPRRAGRAQLEAFLAEHRPWIVRQVDRIAAIAERLPKRWPYGTTLPYCGEEHQVMLREGSRRPRVHRDDGSLTVIMPQPSPERARPVLKRWFVDEARAHLAARTTALAAPLEVTWSQLRVGASEHRWGSCSLPGALCFNYRLVMAPPAVLDYVVVHELCHRLEFNHSPRFWSLVAEHCPQYRDARSWLKTIGPHIGL